MTTTPEQKKEEKYNKKIEINDVVSVPFGNKILTGLVKNIDKDNILINNYSHDDIKIPNNKLVYKFFPGQKFDIRELNLSKSGETKTFSQKLDMFLSKTNIGSYNNFINNHKNDLLQLLKGNLTNNLISGNSLITNKETNQSLMVNWECKLSIYRNADGNLSLDPKFKQEEINYKVYGKELTPDEINKAIEKKQTIVLERVNQNTGEIFKCFCKFDKDLNSFVTSQYSAKVAEVMKKAYVKRETENLKQGSDIKNKVTPEKEDPKKNIFAQKNEQNVKEKKTQIKNKSKKI